MWQVKDNQLYRKLEFSDFKQAFEFMQKVAQEAERQNHHPRWANEYNKVEIWLTTHSEGKITDKDRSLADSVNKIYEDIKT